MLKKITLILCSLFFLTACGTSYHSHTKDERAEHLLEFQKEVGDRVFFAYDTAMLSSDAENVLMRQVEWLKDHPGFKMNVEGHCDERGTREYNIALGERRAHAVKHFLVHNGITADRVNTISYGKERPAVVGDNEAAWSQNRRGVVVLK